MAEEEDKDSGKPVARPKQEFGRIVSHPDVHGGRPFIRKKFGTVEIFCLLDMIRQGVPDKEIIARYGHLHGGLEEDDLHASRAYETRFLSPANDNEPNVFLLDENASYLLLHDITRLFGKSSHVMAEGLEHHDDEKDIWEHMVANKCKAILTSDDDFKRIARRRRGHLIRQHGNLQDCPEHVPAVVYCRKHLDRGKLESVLVKNRAAILDYLAANDAAVLSVGTGGPRKFYPDRGAPGYRPPQL